jgi:hypothetical protein
MPRAHRRASLRRPGIRRMQCRAGSASDSAHSERPPESRTAWPICDPRLLDRTAHAVPCARRPRASASGVMTSHEHAGSVSTARRAAHNLGRGACRQRRDRAGLDLARCERGARSTTTSALGRASLGDSAERSGRRLPDGPGCFARGPRDRVPVRRPRRRHAPAIDNRPPPEGDAASIAPAAGPRFRGPGRGARMARSQRGLRPPVKRAEPSHRCRAARA